MKISRPTHPPLRQASFGVIWFVPLAYVLLLRESPQLFAGAGFVVGLLLAVYGLGCLILLGRTPSLRTSSPLDIGLCAMFGALILSAVFSIDPSRSWRLVWNWSACIVAFYCALLILRAGGSVQQLIKVLLIVISLLILAGYQEFFVWAWRWYRAFDSSLRPLSAFIPRVSGVTGSPNILGFFTVISIILAFTYRTIEQGKWPWGARLWLAFAFPMLLMTRSRNALLALAAALAIICLGCLWVWLQGRLSRQTLLGIGGGLFVLGIITVGSIFLLRPTTSLSEHDVAYRLQLWQFAFDNWLEYPLTGSGGDTFATAMLLRDKTVPPAFPLHAAHNWWINILSDHGLIGLAAVLGCWLLLLQFLWRYRGYENWSTIKLGILAALGAFCMHALLDTPEHWVIFTAALLLAALFVLLEPFPRENNLLKKMLFLWWVPVWIGLLWFGYQSFQSARIYEAGLAAADAKDWEAAAQLFEQAQQEALYPETSYYLAAGMANAILAQQDERYLPQAIAAYQRVIAAEPGWPTNHANLAALYWQNEQPDLALSAMQTAVFLAPQIPIYDLNLGLWYVELGEEAAALEAFGRLYQHRDTWRKAPFWQSGLPLDSLASLNKADLPVPAEISKRSEHAAGWLALEMGNYVEAGRVFAPQLLNSPYDGTNYLGQSIAAYMQNNLAEAQQFLEQADLLGTRDPFWRAVIKEGKDFTALENNYLHHSTFNISNVQSAIYGQSIFLRLSLSYDVAPQLTCFSLTPLLEQNFAILRPHLSLAEKEQLATLVLGNGQGLRPCVTIPD